MRLLGFVTCLLLAGTLPALADNVDFTGTVTAGCALSATTNGTLALNPAGDTLASNVGTGTPGSVTILSIGSNTLTVGAPTRTAQPAAYVATGEALEVSYTGASGLSAINQGFTASQTTQPLGTIAASILTIHNRITNSNGFPAGTYSTRTVVTCAP